MPLVDILLATYNGAKYLPDQLASLQAQTHTNWRLIVRDDGSNDGSLNLVRHWAAETRRALIVVEDGDTLQGPAKSFARLMALSDAPYFAFCDQDDVWLEHKIKRLLDEIKTLEIDFGQDVPLLVHSDLAVVDAELNSTGKLFWEQAHISTVSFDKLERCKRARTGLLLQNVVTGCAALGNSELRRRATPQPNDVLVHDWWVTLISAYFGAIRGVPEPLVRYRQHGGNAIGSMAWNPISKLKRFLAGPVHSVRSSVVLLTKLQLQAQCFFDSYGNDFDEFDRKAVLEFATLSKQSFINRKTFMIRRGGYPKAWLRRLVLFFIL